MGEKRILLHTCCAPCASHCIGVLQAMGYQVTLFYSNANIAPHEEFEKRLAAVRILAAAMHVDVIVDAPDHADWLMTVAQGYEDAPERGARCARCFRYSLARTAAAMRAGKFDAFTTSLTVSPHKVSATVFAAGVAVGGDAFLAVDFKKNDGFLHSRQLTAALGLYRQSYCGCEFGGARMRICIDFDDVLSETARGLVAIAASAFGRNETYDDLYDFNLKKVFHFDDAQMMRFVELSHEEKHLAAYEPVAGAVDGVRALVAAGHDVMILTGRPATAYAGTTQWLQHYALSDIPLGYVDKYGRATRPPCGADVPRTISREEFLAMRFDVAIEDSPLALDLLRMWQSTHILIFDRPWNAHYRPESNMTRVQAWSDITRLLCP